MRIVRLIALAVALTATSALVAAAQERGDVGISMGYPSSVAVIWHATERVAIRPQISFVWSSSESDTDSLFGADESSNDSFGTGIGVDGLFTLREDDRLRTYAGGGFKYVRSSYTFELPTGLERDGSNDGLELSGFFGAQYAVGERFSVFGEVGLAYASSSAEFGFADSLSEVRNRAFGTRTTAGVTLYF